MAAGRIIIPGWMPAVDADGTPIPNAKMFFYLNNTTTLATVYADTALSIPLSNPVLASSAGQWPAVWADDANLFSVSVDAPYGPPGIPFTFDDLGPSTSTNASAAGKADIDGANIPPVDAPVFRENIEAAPERVLTYTDSAPVDPEEQRRLVTEKLRDIVNAQDGFEFETVKDTDAKASLEALFAERREDGGDVILSPGMVRVSSLHIPAGVTVRGSSNRPGEEKGTRDYTRLGTIIWLDPGGTITLEDLASLENVTILNPELRYVKVINGVPDATEAQVMGTAVYTTGPFAGQYAGVAQYSGTAITINGDDTVVKDCLVIGFEWAYKSPPYADPPPTMTAGPARQNISGLWADCTNGIDISESWDVGRIRDCHMWGFFVAHTGFSWAAVKRNGIAYHFHEHIDGMMLTNCFGLGWTVTYRLHNTYAMVLTGCTGDGLVDGSMSDPNSIGFLTEGYAAGMQLNGVRCDGNKRNFVFNHTQGVVTGEIIGGITADGTNVEFAAGSNGATLDIAALGDANFPVFIGTGAQNVTIRSLTCFYIGADTSELITLQDPADIKSVSIGPVNLKDGGFGYHTHGFRVRDKIIAGGRQDVVTELRGAPTGTPAAVAAVSSTEASIDIEACGTLPNNSRVNIVRRSLAGVRQRLASFDAENIVPAEWLFRSSAVNSLNMIAAGAATSINFVLEPKGPNGQVIAFSDLVGGANRATFVSLQGQDITNRGPYVKGEGALADVAINVLGKGQGQVRLSNVEADGTLRPMARFFRDTAIFGANFFFRVETPGLLRIGAEGATTDISLKIKPQGAGGIDLDAPVFADDAAAAAGGIPVGMGYITSDGYYKKRVS